MGETRRKFDRDFREGAVRLVRETGKPMAQVARDLGVNEGTYRHRGGQAVPGQRAGHGIAADPRARAGHPSRRGAGRGAA